MDQQNANARHPLRWDGVPNRSRTSIQVADADGGRYVISKVRGSRKLYEARFNTRHVSTVIARSCTTIWDAKNACEEYRNP